MTFELHDELHPLCPNCGEALDTTDNTCSGCGFTLSGAKLYNPRHFVLLAALLSGFVPIFLSAANYGQLGRTDSKRQLLFGGFIAYLVVFSILMLLPDTSDRSSTKILGWLINLPVGYLLRERQRPLYSAAIQLGAQRASLLRGTIRGFGLLLCAIAIPALTFVGISVVQVNRGVSLMEQGRYEEASLHFEKLYRADHEDADVVNNLAICYIQLEMWDKAAICLDTYIQSDDENATAHALLGYVRDVQGFSFLAERHYNRAEELSPGIVAYLFNPDSDLE